VLLVRERLGKQRWEVAACSASRGDLVDEGRPYRPVFDLLFVITYIRRRERGGQFTTAGDSAAGSKQDR
jgi:hypothetical protein